MGIDSAVTVFSLALAVACVGITYRYLTSSVARLYRRSLRDALGPLGDRLLRSPLTSDLRIRGAFQVSSFRPPRLQLPLSDKSFIQACETILPGVYGEAITILKRPGARQEWESFIARLRTENGAHFASREIVAIDDRFTEGDDSKLASVRRAIFGLFPDIDSMISRYQDFLEQIESANRRRNFRQFTVIATVFCLSGDLTLNRLFAGSNQTLTDKLFDARVLLALPSMIRHGNFLGVLAFLGGCAVPIILLAGLADLLDRRLFEPNS
jgi:hypothetical protein